MKDEIKKIALLTSGGDAPGMNACIRAVVRAGIYYNLEVYGIKRGYQGLIENDIQLMSSRSVSNIIQRGGTILKSARSKDFMLQIGMDAAYQNLKNKDIDALIVIGGDGTFTGANIFSNKFDIPIIGIPGTIDNDLNKHTSELSASIKFGCISIREMYYALRSKTALIRQLYWRDFYANVMYEFPRVLGHSLKPKYDKINWHHNSNWFNAWKKGETGYPIVDAGMRQMNTTGYMHNRARLIVASFLVKTLLIDWREGEEYFAQTLTDYDVANNNGNWQWIASSGADSQQFYRIFNPWLQGENFDKDCEYIKKWVPELSTLDPKIIHNWETEWVNHKDIKYPKPICNYSQQKEKVLKMYKDALY